jgi:hypothetical protein
VIVAPGLKARARPHYRIGTPSYRSGCRKARRKKNTKKELPELGSAPRLIRNSAAHPDLLSGLLQCIHRVVAAFLIKQS